MALSPSRYSSQSKLMTSSPVPTSHNSMALAVQNPSPLPLPQMSQSTDRRPLDLPTRSNSPVERIQLPSIRRMLNFELEEERPEVGYRSDPGVSPNSEPAITIRQRQLDHPSSPVSHKRRRLSPEIDFESEHRDTVVPRLDRWTQPPLAQRSQSAAVSPRPVDRRSSNLSTDSWPSQSSTNHTSPYSAAGPNTRPRAQTPPYEMVRQEWQPSRYTLPSLQTLTQAASMPRPRSTFNEYALDSSRPGATTFPQLSRPSFDPPTTYHHDAQPAYTPYGYQQPRGLSYPGPSGYAVTHDRMPFSASAHHGYAQSGFGYGIDSGDGEAKQRKRRGNLPKETTDILRTWFVAHLHHPYPTEDEKQDLMRQTGLQMNQISNWFINARRRQLPAMINNARAESDARSARSGPSTDYGDADRVRRAESVGLSDGGSQYGQDDGDFEMRGRVMPMRGRSRESI